MTNLGTPTGDLLLPAERRTVHLGGKAYMWHRQTPYGPLGLFPGYAPGDPQGCQGAQTPVLVGAALTYPRVCVLHRAHGTRHLHKPQLDTPGEWWGDPPKRMLLNRRTNTLLPPTLPADTPDEVLAHLVPVVTVEGLGGLNVTTGQEPDRTGQPNGRVN